MGSNQQFSLRWNNYLRHITNAFDSLRSDEDLVDVTLSCEGKRIRAHKMLLSACSTYFRDLFKENPCQHPVIIFRSVKFEDLSALIDFMYQGEVNVVQDQLASFLTTAELLAVQGLSDGRDAPGPTGDDEDDIKEIEIPDSPGTPKEPEVPVIKPTKKTVPASAGASNVRVSSPQAQQYPDKKPSAQYTDKKPPAQTASAPSSSSEPAAHPPAPKRRKWSAEKATPSSAPRNLAPSPDPIEVIPVMPNLKVEAPDYCELGDDDGSYGDSNSGPGGGPDPMAQLLDSKQDFSELYSTNSRDSSLTQSESFLASDLSQLLSKPGPSGENQSQDSLQGPLVAVPRLIKPYACNQCHKMFKHPASLRQHFKAHTGETKCPLCHAVMNRKYELREHMRRRHNVVHFARQQASGTEGNGTVDSSLCLGDGDMAQLVFLCETRLSTSPDVAAVGTQTETKGLFDNRGGGKNQFTTAPEGDTGKLPFLPPTGVLLAQDTTGTPVISSDSGAGIGSFTSCSDGTSSKRTYMPAQDAASTSLTPLDGVTSKGQFMVGLSLSGQDGAAGELQFTAVQAGAAGEVQFTTVPASGSRFMMSGPPTDSMLSTEGLGYVCKICGKAFRRQNSCYDHMAYHQGTTRCTVCNVMLSRKGNMKRHMRMVHGITEEPPQGSESLGNLSGVEVKMEDTT